MEKKLKDSVKTEMKAMVQKELAKIMAKKISKEDVFKNMIEETMNELCEDSISDLHESKTQKLEKKEHFQDNLNNLFGTVVGPNKLNSIYGDSIVKKASLFDDIKNGKRRDEMFVLVNKEFDNSSIPSRHNGKKKAKYECPKELNLNSFPGGHKFSAEQIETMFNYNNKHDECEKKVDATELQELIFKAPNEENFNALKNITKIQAIQDYTGIQYTEQVLDKLFNYVEKIEVDLEATHIQTHFGNTSTEVYHVANKNNEKLFSFDIEIIQNLNSKNKRIYLKNVIFDGCCFPQGNVENKRLLILLELAKNIYSETIIKPLSKTEPINLSETDNLVVNRDIQSRMVTNSTSKKRRKKKKNFTKK